MVPLAQLTVGVSGRVIIQVVALQWGGMPECGSVGWVGHQHRMLGVSHFTWRTAADGTAVRGRQAPSAWPVLQAPMQAALHRRQCLSTPRCSCRVTQCPSPGPPARPGMPSWLTAGIVDANIASRALHAHFRVARAAEEPSIDTCVSTQHQPRVLADCNKWEGAHTLSRPDPANTCTQQFAHTSMLPSHCCAALPLRHQHPEQPMPRPAAAAAQQAGGNRVRYSRVQRSEVGVAWRTAGKGALHRGWARGRCTRSPCT